MTEKELKKLSRLELLELLLEASTENHELKEEIAKLKVEIDNQKSIQQLSTAIQQVENALKYANRLANVTKGTVNVDSNSSAAIGVSPTLLDKEIYKQLLSFYFQNPDLLSTLPLELQIAIKERTTSVLEKEN